MPDDRPSGDTIRLRRTATVQVSIHTAEQCQRPGLNRHLTARAMFGHDPFLFHLLDVIAGFEELGPSLPPFGLGQRELDRSVARIEHDVETVVDDLLAPFVRGRNPLAGQKYAERLRSEDDTSY